MYTLTVFLFFSSVWSLFAVSKKVEFAKTNLTLTLSKNTKAAQIAALVSFVLGYLTLSYKLGTAVALLSGSVLWMILGSLVLLFAPFPRLKWYHLLILLFLILGLELLFTYIF